MGAMSNCNMPEIMHLQGLGGIERRVLRSIS